MTNSGLRRCLALEGAGATHDASSTAAVVLVARPIGAAKTAASAAVVVVGLDAVASMRSIADVDEFDDGCDSAPSTTTFAPLHKT